MKLKNKKTGKIIDITCHKTGDFREKIDFLAELNEDWEDYEEPAYYYFIQDDGQIGCDAVEPYNHKPKVEEHKSIGNYFETKEEAEKAVEKLKAWKRLKDKGVRIVKRSHGYYGGEMFWECPNGTGVSDKQIWLDLDLLFGGEE